MARLETAAGARAWHFPSRSRKRSRWSAAPSRPALLTPPSSEIRLWNPAWPTWQCHHGRARRARKPADRTRGGGSTGPSARARGPGRPGWRQGPAGRWGRLRRGGPGPEHLSGWHRQCAAGSPAATAREPVPSAPARRRIRAGSPATGEAGSSGSSHAETTRNRTRLRQASTAAQCSAAVEPAEPSTPTTIRGTPGAGRRAMIASVSVAD